ncbi:MAG: deoxyribonuclease HsdR [Bacteroidetes bacterium HGW-Bacteroidetes-17]|nr:MAG: deoxyribonuclease HsdR [Bacteroidetes bacterium HGW-Bacteroidetes-17]
MKRFLEFTLVALLSALFVVIIVFVVIKKEDVTNHRQNIQSTQLPVSQTSFNAADAVTGPDFRVAADRSVHAVVHIRTQFRRKTESYDDFFGSLREYLEGRQRPSQSAPMVGFGSGVIISEDGYIVTNNHVVEGGDKIEVTLNDKRLYEAKLVGRDASTDLALIKIDTKDLPFLVYGNSDEVQIGEWVLAVGNPFNLTSTVTAGIISAKARNINILGGSASIESFIQTDAAVNRGNSGGALVNTSGQLVGINAAIASRSGSYEGYSFAIPVNIVKKVMDDLLNYGEIQRAYIGVSISDINAELAEKYGIETLQGVYISSVAKNGGADKAGIMAEDVIIQIDNVEIKSSSALLETIGQHHPGDKVNVKVLRKNKPKIFTVTLQNENGALGVVKSDDKFLVEELGAYFQQISTEIKAKLNIENGIEITQLNNGKLKDGGVREGFIILRVDNYIINSKLDIETAISESKNGAYQIEGIYPNGMRIIYGFTN